MAEFVAVEVVPSSVDCNVGIIDQLCRSAQGLIRPKYVQLRQGFETHPITSIFLATFVSLAFLPILAASTVSLFIVVFIACATLFGGLFLIIVFQLALVLTLVALLGLLAFLAAGVTASLVMTVIAGQKASLYAAHLRVKCTEYDWPSLITATSVWFSTIAPQVVRDEVSSASVFLSSMPSRDFNLGVRAGESFRAIGSLQFPFPSLPSPSNTTNINNVDNTISSPPDTQTSQPILSTIFPHALSITVATFKFILSVLKSLFSSLESALAAYMEAKPSDLEDSTGEGGKVKADERGPGSGASTSVGKGKGRELGTTLSERRPVEAE